MSRKPTSIDAYLVTVSPEHRSVLSRLRRTIHECVRDLEEVTSYGMPAFKHEGHVVAGFLATARGCSYFPFSGTTLATLEAELGDYSQTKSALHFEPARGLPATLVRKLLRARLAETKAATAARKAKPKAKAAAVARKEKPKAKPVKARTVRARAVRTRTPRVRPPSR